MKEIDENFDLGEALLEEQEREGKQHMKAAEACTRPSQLHGTYNSRETVKLKLSTVRDIFSYEDPAYLIVKLIVENALIILSAYAGVGKSLLALFIAYAVITGKKLFGHFSVTKRGKVLIVDEENPGAFIKKRLQDIGFTEDMPLLFLHFQRIKLDNPSCFGQLVKIIEEEKPVLVIIDALIRVHDGKENEASDMAPVMERLRDLVNLGTTVLVIHHHRKGAGENRKESLRGSSDILGGVDMHLSLEEKGEFLFLSSPKTRMRPIEPVKLRIENDGEGMTFRYAGNEMSETQVIVGEIGDMLQDDIKLGVTEIFEGLKNRGHEIGQNRLRDILQAATGRELVETTGTRGKKLYGLNPTFTASRDIYMPLNCEAGKDPSCNLHSFTDLHGGNCEPEIIDVEVTK
ncbi:MAG: helicase RepA family protein [Alphaproteobacteria bacterium]|uniref:Helicase RepA family protein n=1 Tax=Candidatus Nitrobium versatile TaxID=2884831 RepID=A0A953J7Y1_9BACT|nr:helicase RepA family protein [Candidatus Nitrobium versatile]